MTDSTGFWTDRPTLITGATGLVGGCLVRKMIAAGADVVCLVRDWVPQSELIHDRLVENVKVVRGDIADQALLERVLAEYEIDTVFHLAAQTIVGIANRSPISTFESNIAGTWALLEACRRNPMVKQIVLASSDKAYGGHPDLPYDEETPLRGAHPYDVSKSCADLIAQTYANTYDTPVAITRCGNFFGEGDLNWNRIVPGTVRSIVRDQNPIIRSDGKFVRDYFYVQDGVEAYILLAERMASDRASCVGQAFNFSNEQPMTVLELVQDILRIMNSNLELDIRNEASSEIHSQYLSAAKAHEMLDWKPIYSLEQGLEKTIAWYQEFLGVTS